jgi:methylase of polypeptide subunit release factors
VDAETAQRVSDALRRSSYTVDGVVERIGVAAVAALARNEKAPARHALGSDRDALATLIRLLLVGERVGLDDARAALPVEAMGALLTAHSGEVMCELELSPHAQDDADWWVLSDRTDASGHPMREDHVLGVGGASTTLAQLTVRRPVDRALDIGTGCGVQALHLSRHATRVTATDSVPRALRLAATGFALSGVDVELVEGDLTEPLGDREFDLVVCNPPFVVGPSSRFAYRDSGREGDAMSRDAVRGAADVLAPGGVAHLLVNWLHVRGEDWRDRAGSWVADLGCDAWLIERDMQDPVDYVSTWLADAGERDESLAQEWLRWFDGAGVEGVGFGWVLLRRGEAPHRVAVEEVTHHVDQPLGAHFADWLDRVAWLRRCDDAALLDSRLVAAPVARLDVAHTPPDWAVAGRALALDEGFRWQLPCDEATAAIVRGCDGHTPLRSLVDVLAAVLDVPESELAPAVCATVRGLVDRGLLNEGVNEGGAA